MDNTTRVNKATFVPTKVNSANKLTHREPIDDSATASAKYNAPAPGFNRRCSSLLPKGILLPVNATTTSEDLCHYSVPQDLATEG